MNTYGQVFLNDFHFITFYVMRKINEAHAALTRFHSEVGVPPTLIADSHPSLTDEEFTQKVRGVGSRIRTTEAYT